MSNSQSTPSTKIRKPIFVVGAGHSGNSIVGKAITSHPDIVPWAENNKLWVWGNAFNKSDTLTEKDVTPKIKSYIQSRFEEYLRKSGKARICDKTPKNCLRIPFILSIFPDAKIIHVVRDGRAVISSTKNQIEKKHYPLLTQLKIKLKGASLSDLYVFIPRIPFVLKKVLGLPVGYWGSKPENWEEWSKDKPFIKLAKQWNHTVAHAISTGEKYTQDNYLEVRYEDFISNPADVMTRIGKFAEIEDYQPLIDFCDSNIDPTRNSHRIGSLSTSDIAEIMPIISNTLSRLGYES